MGRAERVARGRVQSEALAAELRERQEKQRAEDDLTAQRHGIEPLRLQALDVLRARGWPDGTLIKPYGPFWKRSKAGWKVGSLRVMMHGEAVTPRPVYLLSNGKWGAHDDYEKTTEELLKGGGVYGIEEGLQALIDRYKR